MYRRATEKAQEVDLGHEIFCPGGILETAFYGCTASLPFKETRSCGSLHTKTKRTSKDI